jgi:hypothetical protein
MRSAAAIALIFLALSQAPGAAEKPLLAQQPALSATQIVFVVAGDLWKGCNPPGSG